MSIESQTEYKLKPFPEERISAVKFAPSSNQFLLVSSWDFHVRLYDVVSNSLRHKYSHDAPVYDCCFTDAVHSYSGGEDNTLKSFDFNSTSETIIGSHKDAIQSVEYCSYVNGILTGSWDHYLKLWDPRTPKCHGNYNQGKSVDTMSVCGEKIVVGTRGRKILVWDVRNMSHTLQKRKSLLEDKTQAIRCFPNKQGFVLSSIRGSASVEYFDTSPEVQKKKYAFKCHTIKEGGIEKEYSVDAISFHPTHNTFATGGSDGYVNIWDGFNKKRLRQFHPYPASIRSLSFSSNGSSLAIACCYYSVDVRSLHPILEDSIYIRTVTDQETKPKLTNS